MALTFCEVSGGGLRYGPTYHHVEALTSLPRSRGSWCWLGSGSYHDCAGLPSTPRPGLRPRTRGRLQARELPRVGFCCSSLTSAAVPGYDAKLSPKQREAAGAHLRMRLLRKDRTVPAAGPRCLYRRRIPHRLASLVSCPTC